jgi:hypothetical protein
MMSRVTLWQTSVANPRDEILIGQGIKVQQGLLVPRSRLTRITAHLGLDGVEQTRGQPGRDLDLLLAQILRHQGAGGAEIVAEIRERHPLEVARGIVMIENGVERAVFVQVVPARVGLAIDHDHRFLVYPIHLVDRVQFDVEQLDHGSVLGSTDQSIACQAGGLLQAGLDQVSQAHHGSQAIRVRVHVGYEGHTPERFEAGQETIGGAC